MTDEPDTDQPIEDLDATEQDLNDVKGGFFRPSPAGDGTTQHFVKAPIKTLYPKIDG